METWVIVIMVVGAILVGYVVTSVLLFVFPTVLHRKKCLKFKCRHISHRGGAGEHLENTITAFRHAASVGTDMLELDCQLTKDGEVVVSHDNSLERVTGVDCCISDTNYADLPPLKPELDLDFDSYHVTAGSQEDRSIALLRDVFTEFPNMPINLDVKRDCDELMEKVNILIKEFNREEITVWGNFSNIVTDKLHKLNPNIPLFFSMKRIGVLMVLFYTGLLPFVPLRESCFEVPVPRMFFNGKRFKRERFTKLQSCLIGCVDFLMIRKSLIRHLEKRGIQTFSWVLNEEEEFAHSIDYGFSGIMTDFPSKLANFLSASRATESTSLFGDQ